MELTDDSVDESPFRKKAVSSCISSRSFNEISDVTHSNNGNPFSLFYSPGRSAIQPNNVIQCSRASNSWIASLRSGNQRSNLSTSALDSRQHHKEVSPKKDDSGRINRSGTAVMLHVRSTSIDGRLSSSSHSLTCSSSFRHWGSLESIQRNQRLKQLAAQSSTKVRSFSARESTATAERWRYIQTVLERRRKENLEHRERFIRQPLDNILRHKATKPKRIDPPTWHSFVADRSILKRQSFNWRIKSRRRVHFDMTEQLNEMTDHYRDEGHTLPNISIPEETEEPSNESSLMNEEDLRLPPLITPSPGIEIIKDEDHHDDTSQLISPSGPSWVERQVAKVRQRKLWALRQQQQHNHQKQQEKLNYPMRRVMQVKGSQCVKLVNVPDERDTEMDSLNEEDQDQGNRSDCEQRDETISRKAQAWEVMLDRDEWTETPDEQIKDDPTVDSYGGWPHFPVKLAICIQQRQNSLKERNKARRKEETRYGAILKPSNNMFSRRKRFSNRVSIVADRQQKPRVPKRLLSSPIHQSQVIQRSSHSANADESDSAVFSIPNDGDTFLINAISSLQVLDTPNLPLPIHADVDSAMSFKHKSNEFHATNPSLSSPSDIISESDVTRPTLLEEASVSLDSDAETIVADSQYHLAQLIEAHDDSMTSKKADDEDYYQSAGSAFCPANVYQKREEISNVTADDGPYRIDQQESNAMTIPKQNDDGMESRLDSISAGISYVDKTEHHISPTVHGIGSAVGRKLPTYCSSWPRVIPNKNDDAIPPYPMTTVSYWNNFEDPTSEETMAGIINQPEVDISSEATAFALLVDPGTQKDSNQPPPVSPVIIQNSLDKKTKEARNASTILFPAVMSIPTQTEAECGQGSKNEPKVEEGKMLNDSMDAKELDGTGAECQCLHRVVLTCLLPEAAETLANLELIRQHLKKARIRRQGGEQQRQPLQVRRDTFSGIDQNTST